jgi:hypothetical protein
MREKGEGERTRWGQKFDYQVIRRKFGNYLQNGIDSIGGRAGDPSPPPPLTLPRTGERIRLGFKRRKYRGWVKG